MTLRPVELSRIAAELSRSLAGLPVHKVIQPSDEQILLQLRGRWLLVDTSPRFARLHLVDERPAGTGEEPPAFCMLLRKHLVGARLVDVRAVEGERACELELASADDEPCLRLFLFGPAAQLQLVARGDDGERRVLGAIGPARRTYEALPPPLPQAAATQADRFADVPDDALSSAIDARYATIEREQAVQAARRQAQGKLDAELRKQRRLVDALSADLARADEAAGKRRQGDLLLAHLHEVPRGAGSVTLPDDFTDGSPVTIVLDPARSARDNAARLYKEHKRLQRARAAIAHRLDETRARIEGLERERSALEQRSDEELLTDARPAPAPRRAQRIAPALPYRRFTSATGVPIFVGRGANKNDELTFRVARGNDLWLHTRDVPGAHVVVPTEGGRAVDPDTLVDAATLAAHHSSARDEAQVDVGYALRKHLRKPKGAPPGAVLVSNQKTIRVRMEPARLERLLKSRVD